jgi:hypothetical protein
MVIRVRKVHSDSGQLRKAVLLSGLGRAAGPAWPDFEGPRGKKNLPPILSRHDFGSHDFPVAPQSAPKGVVDAGDVRFVNG